jgi:vitamin B12 transporter
MQASPYDRPRPALGRRGCALRLGVWLLAASSATPELALAAEPEPRTTATPAPEEAGGEAEAQAGAQPPLQVEVQGSRATPTDALRDPTIATYVVRGESLRQPGLGLAQVLGRVPGVQVTRSGGDADLATAAVRGASSAQTPIYLGGVRLNDDLTGTVDLSTVPLWLLDRVEVYRGHAPAAADRFGIGGAILLEPTLPQGQRLGGGFGLGSFGWNESHVAVALGGPKAGALLGVRHEAARNDFDFLDDRGTAFDPSDDRVVPRMNADAESLDAWGIGRLALGPSGALTAVLNGFRRDAGAPGLQLIAARHARAAVQRMLGGVTAKVPCPAAEGGPHLRGPCQLELSTGLLLTRYRLHDPLRELGLGSEIGNAGERVSQRLAGRVGLADWLELSWGGLEELEQLRVDVDRDPTLRAWRGLTRLELGAEARAGSALELVLSSALECHSTGTPGGVEACGVLEPLGRIGARLHLAEPVSLLANVGRYARVPTLGELYGTSSTVAGNPELAVEQGWTADLGVSASGHAAPVSGYAQLVGFLRFASDLIAYRRSSFGVVRPYNTDSARILGVELAGGLELWDVLELGLSLTGMDPRDTSDDRQVSNDLLPLQARLALSPSFGVHTPRHWPFAALEQARLGVSYSYRSSRVADPAGLLVLGEQGELELEAALQLFDGTLAVRAVLSNLLDQHNLDLVGYPLPGRAAHVGMEAWW